MTASGVRPSPSGFSARPGQGSPTGDRALWRHALLTSVALGLSAATEGSGAGPALLASGRSQSAVTGRARRDRASPGSLLRDVPLTGPATLTGPRHRQSLRLQFGRGAIGQLSQPNAHSRQGLLEDLGLLPCPRVLGSCKAAAALLRDSGCGRPTVLAHVFRARPPDLAVESHNLVLVQPIHRLRLRFGDQQSLGVAENSHESRVHW